MAKPLAVLGLDALAWETLDRAPFRFPCLAMVREGEGGWRAGHLAIDGIAHSAPSWTTIFSGAPVDEHGIKYWRTLRDDGTRGKRITRADIPVPLVWEKLCRQGIDARAFNIYATLPPFSYRVESFEPLKLASGVLSYAEVARVVFSARSIMTTLIAQLTGFIATITVILDRAHHLSHKRTGDSLTAAWGYYDFVDQWLWAMLSLLDGAGYDVLLVSDHGLPGPAHVDEETGQKVPAHHPMGMVATNAKEPAWLPETSLKVTPWILDHFA